MPRSSPRLRQSPLVLGKSGESRSDRDLFERLQLWSGIDCEAEWFDIPLQGVEWRQGNVDLRAGPQRLVLAVGPADLRVRAVFRIESDGNVVRIESNISEGGSIVIRDAFGLERLQLTEGVPSLALHLGVGRYSVEAQLGQGSTLVVNLTPSRSSTTRAS